MANQNELNKELKSKIETVILESYKKTKEKNFQELNFIFPKNTSVIGYLKNKIKVFKNLDEYSATFLSIFTRAKITLREFQSKEFEGNYLELLRLVLTLPDNLGNGKLKSIKVELKAEIDLINTDNYKVGKNLTSEEYVSKENINSKKVFVKAGITGKKLSKQNDKFNVEIEELNNIDFEDEEHENEEDDLTDIKF